MFNFSWLFYHTQLWTSLLYRIVQSTKSMMYHSQTLRSVTLLSFGMHSEHLLQLVVTTTHNLLVYALPTLPLSPTSATETPKKRKKKGKASNGGLSEKTSLSLQKSVPLPPSIGEGSTFRAARYIMPLIRLCVSYSGLLDTIHKTNGFYLVLSILFLRVHGIQRR